MSQNHFTLSFPLKSPSDAKLLADQLPPLMPELFRVNDTIWTVHYSRFTVLSEKTLLFLGDFDGEFGQLMADLARPAGPVFDAVNLYTAYPSVTAKEIKTLASAADVAGNGVLNPFLVILPIKSKLAFIE